MVRTSMFLNANNLTISVLLDFVCLVIVRLPLSFFGEGAGG